MLSSENKDIYIVSLIYINMIKKTSRPSIIDDLQFWKAI